jgi:hypothetical protein
MSCKLSWSVAPQKHCDALPFMKHNSTSRGTLQGVSHLFLVVLILSLEAMSIWNCCLLWRVGDRSCEERRDHAGI